MKPDAIFDLLLIGGIVVLSYVFGYNVGRFEKDWKRAGVVSREVIARAKSEGDGV